MLDIESEERKVINEFCHLLEKSKQLFNGLRDLPQVNIFLFYDNYQDFVAAGDLYHTKDEFVL